MFTLKCAFMRTGAPNVRGRCTHDSHHAILMKPWRSLSISSHKAPPTAPMPPKATTFASCRVPTSGLGGGGGRNGNLFHQTLLYFLSPRFFHCAPSCLKSALCSLKLSQTSSNVFPKLLKRTLKLLFCTFF